MSPMHSAANGLFTGKQEGRGADMSAHLTQSNIKSASMAKHVMEDLVHSGVGRLKLNERGRAIGTKQTHSLNDKDDGYEADVENYLNHSIFLENLLVALSLKCT